MATRPERVAQFERPFHDDLAHWIAAQPRLAGRLMDLVDAVLRDPFRGVARAEPLRHLGPNLWSRRLTDEHRLVYRVEHDRIVFLRVRGHYDE